MSDLLETSTTNKHKLNRNTINKANKDIANKCPVKDSEFLNEVRTER